MKLIIRTLAVAALFPLAACQSTQTTATVGTSAVMCDKCKTVWVKRPENVGVPGKSGSYTTFRNRAAMTCPECETAVVSFFKTGKLAHRCSHCGGTPTHCEAH